MERLERSRYSSRPESLTSSTRPPSGRTVGAAAFTARDVDRRRCAIRSWSSKPGRPAAISRIGCEGAPCGRVQPLRMIAWRSPLSEIFGEFLSVPHDAQRSRPSWAKWLAPLVAPSPRPTGCTRGAVDVARQALHSGNGARAPAIESFRHRMTCRPSPPTTMVSLERMNYDGFVGTDALQRNPPRRADRESGRRRNDRMHVAMVVASMRKPATHVEQRVRKRQPEGGLMALGTVRPRPAECGSAGVQLYRIGDRHCGNQIAGIEVQRMLEDGGSGGNLHHACRDRARRSGAEMYRTTRRDHWAINRRQVSPNGLRIEHEIQLIWAWMLTSSAGTPISAHRRR